MAATDSSPAESQPSARSHWITGYRIPKNVIEDYNLLQWVYRVIKLLVWNVISNLKNWLTDDNLV